MNETEFLAAISFFGEENILAIHFNNASRCVFKKNKRFTLADNYVASIGCVKFVEEDVKGTKVDIYKPLVTLETFTIAQEEDAWNTISSRLIGG
jgi:hypothetical protein